MDFDTGSTSSVSVLFDRSGKDLQESSNILNESCNKGGSNDSAKVAFCFRLLGDGLGDEPIPNKDSLGLRLRDGVVELLWVEQGLGKGSSRRLGLDICRFGDKSSSSSSVSVKEEVSLHGILLLLGILFRPGLELVHESSKIEGKVALRLSLFVETGVASNKAAMRLLGVLGVRHFGDSSVQLNEIGLEDSIGRSR